MSADRQANFAAALLAARRHAASMGPLGLDGEAGKGARGVQRYVRAQDVLRVAQESCNAAGLVWWSSLVVETPDAPSPEPSADGVVRPASRPTQTAEVAIHVEHEGGEGIVIVRRLPVVSDPHALETVTVKYALLRLLGIVYGDRDDEDGESAARPEPQEREPARPAAPPAKPCSAHPAPAIVAAQSAAKLGAQPASRPEPASKPTQARATKGERDDRHGILQRSLGTIREHGGDRAFAARLLRACLAPRTDIDAYASPTGTIQSEPWLEDGDAIEALQHGMRVFHEVMTQSARDITTADDAREALDLAVQAVETAAVSAADNPI